MSDAIETLIEEGTARRLQLPRTLEGIQQKLELENHHLKTLIEKREELARRRSLENPADVTVADYIAKLLVEKGGPMRPIEIAEALAAHGLRSEAENGHMSAVLSALSRRTDMFRRIERGLYWLNCEETARILAARKRIPMTVR